MLRDNARLVQGIPAAGVVWDMKILMVHEDTREPGQGGGAESLLRDMTVALRARGHEVAWLHSGQIARAVDAFRPDVVHIGTIHNAIGYDPVRWLLSQRVPYCWTMADYWPFCRTRNLLTHDDQPCSAVLGTCDNACGQRESAEVLGLVNSAHVIALCEPSAAILRRHGVNVGSVVELGVDTTMFAPGDETRSAVMTTSAWAWHPVKGMHVLKRAIKGAPYNVQVVTGQPRERVAMALKTARVFVFPSCYEETWGLCVNEAMASGCACVASDVAGARAQIEPTITGLLVPPRDPDALRGAIDWLVGHPERAREMGMAAREHVAVEHSLDAMGRRFEAAYQKAVEAN